MDRNKLEHNYDPTLVAFAIRDAEEFNDLELLTKLLQSRNAALLDSQTAIDFIISRLRGEKRKKPKSKVALEKKIKLGSLAWAYHGAGLVKSNDPNLSKKLSASRKVGLMFNASESLVKQGMDEAFDHGAAIPWFNLGASLGFDATDEMLNDTNFDYIKLDRELFIKHLSGLKKTLE